MGLELIWRSCGSERGFWCETFVFLGFFGGNKKATVEIRVVLDS